MVRASSATFNPSNRARGVALMATVVLLFACGGGEAAAPNAPTPLSGTGFSGRWEGTTSQGLQIILRVTTNGVIDSLTVRLSATLGDVACAGTVTRTGVPVGTDGSFSAAVGIGFVTTLRGRLTTAGTATGSVDPYTGAYAVLCGLVGAAGNGDALAAVQWQAQRQ